MGSFDFTLVTGLGAVTALVFVWWGLRKLGTLGKVRKGRPTRQIIVLIFGALMILPVCGDGPTVPDSNTGSLAVTSDPQGAKIFLDADTLVKGEAPDTITGLTAGTHILKLTHDLCADWDSTVTISSNDVSTVHADLVMTIGQIFADSDPQGAWIFLDGDSIGTVTPDTLDTVGIGEHEIKLTLFCHSDWSGTVNVGLDSMSSVNAELIPGVGSIIIDSEPQGATIYLNSGYQGKYTLDTLEGLEPGEYEITLIRHGYDEWDTTVTVFPCSTITIEAILEPITGTLCIYSNPDGADYWLDDTLKGVTPDILERVPVGSHIVVFRREFYHECTDHVYLYESETDTAMCELVLRCPGDTIIGDTSATPEIELDECVVGAGTISGTANNVDARTAKVVLWALTNQWYVQPLIADPYTKICADGSWSNWTHGWKRMVALLVDTCYEPGSIRITHPALDPCVLAWTECPSVRPDMPIFFSGYWWGVKLAEDPYGPGPNYFAADTDNIWVDQDGLHLRIVYQDGHWTCSEVHLLRSLGYGVYSYQLASHVDSLDMLAVFSGFVYESANREIDIEFSQALANPDNAQYVIQPWGNIGNRAKWFMPAVVRSTHQFHWRADSIFFRSWRGWEEEPSPDSLIHAWTYKGQDIPPPGAELMHINLWLHGGQPPVSGVGDEVIIRSFDFRP